MNKSKAMIAVSGYSSKGFADLALFSLSENGQFTLLSEFTQGDNPSFHCIHNGMLYTCSEMEQYGQVSSYQIKNNHLSRVGEIRYPGQWVCHIAPYHDELVTAGYGSGTVTALPVSLQKEGFTVRTAVHDGESHTHWICVSVPKDRLYAVDLGQNAVVELLHPGDGTPAVRCVYTTVSGSGPRQLLPFVGGYYLINETANTVEILIEANHCLQSIFRTKISSCQNHCQTGGAVVDSVGRLFIATRGPNTVSVFKLKNCTELQKLCEFSSGGNWPRYLAVVSCINKLLVANQQSSTICCFDIKNDIEWCNVVEFPNVSCISEIKS
jgi:6-phosphogluconolactonase